MAKHDIQQIKLLTHDPIRYMTDDLFLLSKENKKLFDIALIFMGISIAIAILKTWAKRKA